MPDDHGARGEEKVLPTSPSDGKEEHSSQIDTRPGSIDHEKPAMLKADHGHNFKAPAPDVIEQSLPTESSLPEDVEKNEKSLELIETKSEAPYSAFTVTQKRCIVAVASLGGFLSPLTSNIYYPALNTIAQDLHVSISHVNLTITTYMIFQAIAPSFMGSFTDTVGRRPAYLIGFTIYIASNIGLGLNHSYAGLMVLRCLQSAGSSSMVTLMVAVVTDTITSAERGSYIAFTQLGSVLGPSVGPILGGLLSQHLGWHWIFWFLAIFAGVFGILILLFYPETCRRIVGDGSIPPPTWNKTLWNLFLDHKHTSPVTSPTLSSPTQAKSPNRPTFNPLASLLLLREKETALVLLIGGIVYAGIYTVLSSLTTQFHLLYPFLTPSQLGLLFLPQALGSICAAFTNGLLLDRNYRRHALLSHHPLRPTRQDDMSAFPIEAARLEIGIPMLLTAALAIIIYGWILHLHTPLPYPLICLFVMGYTTIAGFNTLSVLIVDTHRDCAATASAANNLVRCLMGAGAAAVINPMLEKLGRGGAFTLVGCVELACVPLLGVVVRSGMGWRSDDREKRRRRMMEA